jgi:hypothetical protein
MRWAIDSLVALMIAGVIAGIVLHMRSNEQLEEHRETVRGDVARFRAQVMIQAAIGQCELSDQGFPATIDPAWFKGDEGGLPQNPLFDDRHPWLEVAGPAQSDLVHPSNRVVGEGKAAKFWYNPYTGVVRARVPARISDEESLTLYNFVNGTSLDGLFASGSKFDQPAP